MSDQDYAAGASAARNKVASYLETFGIPVRVSGSGNPPTDDDFLRAIRWIAQKLRTSADSSAVVVFEWTGKKFQVPVCSKDLERVRRRGNETHVLFDAESEKWGRSTFFLARDDEGEVVVFRQKHWRNDEYAVDRFPTAIFELGGRIHGR